MEAYTPIMTSLFDVINNFGYNFFYQVGIRMNSKHRITLKAIFDKPTRKNVLWRDIEKLFEALGAELANKGGSVVTVYFGGKPQTFHRPHPEKEAPAYCVTKVREFLIENNVKP